MSEGDKLFSDDPDGLTGGSDSITADNLSSSASTGSTIEQSRHKTACFFHVLFKAAAMLFYLLFMQFFHNFIIGFVVCVLLLAFDFWTVKNVTGRLLVGLRWWNEVRDDGSNVWIYECKPDTRTINRTDSFWFWSTLWATPAVWLLFGIGALIGFNFSYLLIVAVALALSGANVLGYWKCQKDAAGRVTSFTQNWIVGRLAAQAMGTQV